VSYVLTGKLFIDVYQWSIKLTLLKMIKGLALGALVLSLLASVGVFLLIHYPATQIPAYQGADEHVYLDQGWGESPYTQARQDYYFTPQGTSLKGLEYNWFVHLEMPWGKDRFAEAEHLKAYGFIVQDEPSSLNPDRLPLGFTKHFSEQMNAELLDLTCAACHNGQINVTKDGQRYAIQIDGGQAMHAFTTMKVGHFVPTLLASMASTYFNPFKFDRFAKKVLTEHYNSDSKSILRERFGQVLWRFVKQGYNDSSKHLYPLEEGFGRTDALARIGNTVFGDNLSEENYHVATGPVSYPPVWNIWKFDWVQYGASVKQPMARNMGEALGVGAHISFIDSYGKPLPVSERFRSSVMPENIHHIETTLQSLKPPPWPEQLLGKVDTEKAKRGKALFQQHCVGCHGPFPATELTTKIDTPLKASSQTQQSALPLWIVKTLSIEEIGTDANTAFNFVNNRFDLSKTGLTEQDLSDTVRPLWVKQLSRVVSATLDSDSLTHFLSQTSPQSEQLSYNTTWVEDNKPAFKQVLNLFSNWNNYRFNEHKLNAAIEALSDEPDVINDIKTALVKAKLETIDQVINGLQVNQLTVGEALNITGIIIREKYYQENNFSEAKQACLDGFGALDLPQQPLAYKARPLEGIWATPPFLHNGSVPNIYQLLSPVSERASGFFVGEREYDPVHLGYELKTDKSLKYAGTWFDTQLSGNFNIGHEFRAGYVPWKPGNEPQFGVIGPELTPTQRFELIEYLKVHKDSPNEQWVQPTDCSDL